jgi:hypothetical protein
MSIDRVEVCLLSNNEEHVALLRKRVKEAKELSEHGTVQEHSKACEAVERICSVNIIEYLLKELDQKDQLLGQLANKLTDIAEGIEAVSRYPISYYR